MGITCDEIWCLGSEMGERGAGEETEENGEIMTGNGALLPESYLDELCFERQENG